MGAGLQVYLAGKYFRAGHTINETIEYLKSITNNVAALFMVDSLNHLKKGGRLSSAQAFFGTMLQVKPVLKINNEGTLYVYNKQKGTQKAIQFMADEVISTYKELDNCPICILNADCEDYAAKLEELLKAKLPNAIIWSQAVGPTVGTHCGPGTIGVCFPSVAR